VNTQRCRAGFSLSELIIVITIILLLASMLIVVIDKLYVEAARLRCQHHLEQIYQACVLFRNRNKKALPKAFSNEIQLAGGLVLKVRWYQALDEFLSDSAVLGCPSAETDYARVSGPALPIQGFLLPQGRNPDLWDEIRWDGDLFKFRNWMDDQMPGGFSYETGEVDVTEELLEGKAQFWNCVHFGGSQFKPEEIQHLAAFNRQGHGVHLFSEYFAGVGGEEVNELGAALGYGIHAGDGGYVYTWITYDPNAHPVMKGVLKMATAYTPAGFVKSSGPDDHTVQTVGKMHHREINSSTSPTRDYWHVATWDDGVGRVVVQGGWNAIGKHFERVPPSGTNDVKAYCTNVANWLGYVTEGNCTYGYNNRIGRTARRPAATTILVMDYCDWEIDHDGVESDHDDGFVALRHGGRANALFADGTVKPLRIDEITDGMWTVEPAD